MKEAKDSVTANGSSGYISVNCLLAKTFNMDYARTFVIIRRIDYPLISLLHGVKGRNMKFFRMLLQVIKIESIVMFLTPWCVTDFRQHVGTPFVFLNKVNV